ncbi:abc transporter, putative [Ricinus communis]|uniref:Abc transporter, putative n=1 Tax=Ricinus communis TaxID=3988 RepID=B9R968_RICCO|nr:abc transporter, putative [Ricinus communis]|eukprot:XP_002511543.1 ABC transporter A family member 7 [Ricinus communis]
MAEASSFWTQADALCRKNLIYQKRRRMENCRLIIFPVIFCLLLVVMQGLVDKYVNNNSSGNNKDCGCACVDYNLKGSCNKKICGLHFSNMDTSSNCPIPSPQHWPPLLQLPAKSCSDKESCPVITLLTGNNQSLAENVGKIMFTSSFAVDSSNVMDSLANIALGTDSPSEQSDMFLDDAIDENDLFYVKFVCKLNSTFSFSIPNQMGIRREAKCVQGLNLWRNSSSQINEETYKGNDILAAYDFFNSNGNIFNVSIWYDPSYEFRVARSVNLVSNAYLQFLHGSGTKMLFEFVKEMPRVATKSYLDVSSLLGVLFFTWIILRLFLVVFISLVYEKQQKVRIMMKMHGLGDGPYWMISYAYFLVISLLYMLVFVIFGSSVGLKIFYMNDYSIQFVFYFLYINLQISMGFLLAALFSYVKTATVVGYLCVYGTGLLASYLFQNFLEQTSFPRGLIIVLEIYPGFSLYRGLYELARYSSRGIALGINGMQWGNLNDKDNGMREVLIIMFVEWLAVLFVGYYIDRVLSSGSIKSPLFFLQNFGKKRQSSFMKPNLQRQGSKVLIDMDKPDISQEREKVEQLLLEPSISHLIICDNLKKLYPGRDGNPDKMAVRGLTLALPPGECFGMLGPNGAGKTSFISMMVGLTKQTSGTAYIQGLDIRTQMDRIYTSIGVCPQHDLLWETLTGREHLLFYGRLKNLKGSVLKQAVQDSLKSVKLFDGGVADKQAGKYSGGMKRRLSVAISLIGNPKVVYMDEPSSGLDPATRRNLWNVIKRAKQDRAIILTTHSMEEAEALCDRLGVFVDGSFRCIGNAKELKARYGGSYLFTLTTSSDHEQQVVNMVQGLSPNAERTYHTSGTQKFEIPKHEVRIADVFHAVEIAKTRFPIFAWGLSDTTLEDVFINVANDA